MLPAVSPALHPGICFMPACSSKSLCLHLWQLPTYFLWSEHFCEIFSPSSPCVSSWKKNNQQLRHLRIHGLMCSVLCIYILLPSLLATVLASCSSLWCESELIFKSVDAGFTDGICKDLFQGRTPWAWLVGRKITGLGVRRPEFNVQMGLFSAVWT